MFASLLLQAALAAPPDLAPDPPPVADAATPDDLQGRPPPSGGKKPPPPNGKKPPPKKVKPHWESEPFVRPEAGAQVNSNNGQLSTVVTLGAQAGFRYWRVGDPPPRWAGQSRVRGAIGTGGSASALDFRLGSFIGPQWKVLGLSTGPDLFWNKILSSTVSLEPSLGVEFPTIATVKIADPFSIYGGFSPAWLANPDRRVDWSQVDVPGFGHEFSYLAGANLNLQPLRLGVAYAYRIVATGAQQDIGFSVNLAM